jgi:hypothetical protein
MSTLKRCVLAGVFWGVFNALNYLQSRGGSLNATDILLYFSFGEPQFEPADLIYILFNMLPVVLFQCLFGMLIYRHFCMAGIFYFTRCDNRIRWFLKEAGQLLMISFLYPAVYLLTGILTARITHTVQMDDAFLILLIYDLLIYGLWYFWSTLLINMIAIGFTSEVGFIVVEGIQTIMVAALHFFKPLSTMSDPVQRQSLARWMPLDLISNLLIGWHSSNIPKVQERINCGKISFELNNSVWLMLLISAVVLAAGCVAVKRKEFIGRAGE